MEMLKPFRMAPDQEVALFVTHSATGRIKPHVALYLGALAKAGIAALLIVVTDREVDIPTDLADHAAGVMVRANAGYDFAAGRMRSICIPKSTARLRFISPMTA